MGAWRQGCGAIKRRSFWQRRQIQLVHRPSNSWHASPGTTSVEMSALPVVTHETSGRATVYRLALLDICLLAGVAVGVVGSYATGSQWWYLAVPAVVAMAWLFVANPEQCAQRKP